MTHLLTPTLTAVGLLLYLTAVGFPVMLLAPPARLGRWFWIAAPLVGLIVAAIGLGWLALLLPGGVAGGALLAGALAVSAGCLLRGRRPPAGQHGWEQRAAGGCAVMAMALAVAPLALRPDLAFLGPNGDFEIYLAAAAYLRDSPLGFGLADPAGFPFSGRPNPLLWHENFFDPRWSGLTFQSLHAAFYGLTGLSPDQSFAGLLAGFSGLFSVAVFLLVRFGFRAGPVAAVLAAALTALGVPGLFVVYWGFGQQSAALALVALAALLILDAVREPSVRSRGWAGAVVAATAATYVPALPVVLAVAACAALGQAMGTRAVRRLGASALVIAASAVALVPWAMLRCLARARYFFADGAIAGLTQGPAIRTFPDADFGWGFFAAPEFGFTGLAPAGVLGWPATGAVALLVIAGAVHCWRNRGYGAAFVPLVPPAMLLTQRYLLHYPYGYFKMVPLVVFFLGGMAMAGAGVLWGRTGTWGIALRFGTAVVVTLLMTVNLLFALRFAEGITARSSAFSPVFNLAKVVPAGASIFVSGRQDQWGPLGGAIAFALRDAELYGYLSTSYSSFFRERPDRSYDYVLVSGAEPAREAVAGVAGDPLWASHGVAVWRVPDGLRLSIADSGGAPVVGQRMGGEGGPIAIVISEWTEAGYPKYRGWTPPVLGVDAYHRVPAMRVELGPRG